MTTVGSKLSLSSNFPIDDNDGHVDDNCDDDDDNCDDDDDGYDNKLVMVLTYR